MVVREEFREECSWSRESLSFIRNLNPENEAESDQP